MLIPALVRGENDPILMALSDGDNTVEQLEPGVYVIQHFNFGTMIGNDWEQWPNDVDDMLPENAYGVCDTPEQFFAHELGVYIREHKTRKFCVSFTHVAKNIEVINEANPDDPLAVVSDGYKTPSAGGWRWHKWGPYIGGGKPKCEYLDDETGFDDGVYCYHVYEKRQLYQVYFNTSRNRDLKTGQRNSHFRRPF